MTRDDAEAWLSDAIKAHLAKVVDNVLGDALDQKSTEISSQRYGTALKNARTFETGALARIASEFHPQTSG